MTSVAVGNKYIVSFLYTVQYTSCQTEDTFSQTLSATQATPVQKATPVGGTVQIKQLIVVPDRVLCTKYFVLYKVPYTVCL